MVNSDIKDIKICKWIDVGISYDSNIDKAKEIIKHEILNHPLNIDPRTPEQIDEGVELAAVKVISLGDSAVLLRGWAWAKDSPDAFKMSCDLVESIKMQFDLAGLEIPFPHRTIVHKNNPIDHDKEK